MPAPDRDSFDPVDYLRYLKARWRMPAAAVALAILVSVAICLILPKQYTATATLVIDPPGVDPRAAIALSPVYLESLKAYETFASSDSLFAKAVDKFHLEHDGRPIESIKRRVLRVEKLKDTKLLEIAVTLPDPKQAQAMVQYLAEQTVALDNDIARSGDRELLDDAELKLHAAREQLQQARAQSGTLVSAGSESALENEVQSLAASKGRIEDQRIEANSVVAESVARRDESLAAEARARVATLDSGLAALQKSLDAKSSALASLRERRQRTEDQLANAEDVFETAQKREYDVSNTVKFRTGQLHVVDPGIVPQRSSFPNWPLALLSAAILSAGACLIWLTALFGLASRNPQPSRAGFRVAGGGGR
ncbi:MAG TPA: hypothetical protein VH639_22915 [Bryobacteraceae bacterium]|jgi:uncharacterized protein involved in exopolysaccharide biosynthesis